jgi:predicted ABC-type ATPase
MSNNGIGQSTETARVPRILIVAGPNGAGKTTFAREFLVAEANCPTFVNADLIAAGLSPFAPELAARKAARIMLEAIDEHVHRRESFAFETTLAGRAYAQHIPAWRALGYHVKLFFLRLPNVELAIERVAMRVRQGGHDIPPDVIRRRFASGWENFEYLYKPLVDSWVLFDNSTRLATLMDWSEK